MMIRRTPITELVERFFDENGLLNETTREARPNAYTLALDVVENDNGFQISTALPGVNAEQISVRIHENVLHIHAETSAPQIEENARLVLNERRYGTFSRTLRFTVPVDSEKIEADYSNGILTLNIPKAAEARPRQITVRTSSNS